uniref:Uncharacterized protein n=1 Tax=Rhizophora mucronata TaxID=61149 RepID=A0A2P2J1A6_RHIMU
MLSLITYMDDTFCSDFKIGGIPFSGVHDCTLL